MSRLQQVVAVVAAFIGGFAGAAITYYTINK